MTTALAPAAPFTIEAITYPEIATKIAAKRDEYLALSIAGVNDSKGLTTVHAARMSIKAARVEVEKRRKALKASSLEYGKRVDDAAKALTALLEPIESHLEAEERKITDEKDRIKRAAEEAKRAATQARYDALTAVGCILPWAEVERMDDAQHAAKLAEATEAHRVAQEQAAAEEAERLRKQQEDADKLKAEQEKLAAERAELDKQRAEQAAREEAIAVRSSRLTELRAIEVPDDQITEELLSLPREEFIRYFVNQQNAYQFRKQEERDAQRKVEIEKAQAEAAEQARIETEQRIARETAERKAAEEAEEAERVRRESLRPDREKLIALAGTIELVQLPQISDPKARDAAVLCCRAIQDCAKFIREQAAKL